MESRPLLEDPPAFLVAIPRVAVKTDGVEDLRPLPRGNMEVDWAVFAQHVDNDEDDKILRLEARLAANILSCFLVFVIQREQSIK